MFLRGVSHRVTEYIRQPPKTLLGHFIIILIIIPYIIRIHVTAVVVSLFVQTRLMPSLKRSLENRCHERNPAVHMEPSLASQMHLHHQTEPRNLHRNRGHLNSK